VRATGSADLTSTIVKQATDKRLIASSVTLLVSTTTRSTAAYYFNFRGARYRG
jgi:hypothetical protein